MILEVTSFTPVPDSNLLMLGLLALSVLVGLTLSSCWPVLFSHPSPHPGPPDLFCALHPACCGAQSLGEKASPSLSHPTRTGGWAESWAPRGPCSQAHTPTPTATMARPGPGGVCPSPGLCNSQSVPLPDWAVGAPLSPPPSLHASAVWGRSHHARVMLTTVFQATTAAAALPPVGKKPDLFHILINRCEFFTQLRAAS